MNMDQLLEDIDPDARKKYDRDMKQQAKEVEANEKKAAIAEFKKISKATNAEERKQNADVLRAERAYRKENNIPQSFKTNPGQYHMEGGPKAPSGGGGGGAGIPKVGPKRPLDMKKGGVVSSASKRADGCAVRGKTRA